MANLIAARAPCLLWELQRPSKWPSRTSFGRAWDPPISRSTVLHENDLVWDPQNEPGQPPEDTLGGLRRCPGPLFRSVISIQQLHFTLSQAESRAIARIFVSKQLSGQSDANFKGRVHFFLSRRLPLTSSFGVGIPHRPQSAAAVGGQVRIPPYGATPPAKIPPRCPPWS